MTRLSSDSFFLRLLVVGVSLGVPLEAAASSLHIESNDDPRAILGGDVVDSCAWPAVVSVGGFCTGTFVHPRVVLYAAHCGNEVPFIRFGEDLEGPGREIVPQRCEVHPLGAYGFGTDFAYCVLAEPVTDVPSIAPLMGCEVEQKLHIGQEVTLVGLGTSDDEATPYGIKRQVTTAIASFSWDEIFIGNETAGACYGDSGGPALVQMDDESWRVFGVASWGKVGCGIGTYYSMVHNGLAWIETSSNIDITPCHDGDGNWDPGPDCFGFPTDPHTASGDWESGCSFPPPGGAVTSCGVGFDPDRVDAAAPQLTFAEPGDGTRFELLDDDSATVAVRIEADDADGWGVGEVTLQVLSENEDVVFELADAAAPFAFDNLTFPKGPWTLRALANDRAGNAAVAAEVRIGVAVDPPASEPGTSSGTDGSGTTDASDDAIGTSSSGTTDAGEPPQQDDASEAGCGCSAGGGGQGGGVLTLGIAVLLGLGRRRSRRAAALLGAATLLSGCNGRGPDTDDAGTANEGTAAADEGSSTTSTTADESSSSGDASGETTATTGSAIEPGCGNGVLEEVELCDDGNHVDGDGCNADCTLSGTPLWEWAQGSPVAGYQAATGAAFDPDGNLVVAGLERDAEGVAHGFLGKLTPDGETVWTAVPDTGDLPWQVFNGMAVTQNGNVVVIAREGVVDANDAAVAIRRFDSQGEPVWVQSENPSSLDDVWHDVLPSGENVVVVGAIGHAVGDEPPALDFALRFYNPNGTLLWSASAPVEDAGYSGFALAWDKLNIVVAGSKTSEDETAAWIARYDLTGALVDEPVVYSEVLTHYSLFDVAIDADGNFVTCGRLVRAIAVAPVCFGFSSEGELLWRTKLDVPGQGNDTAKAVSIDSFGNIVVVGDVFDPDLAWQAGLWKLTPQGTPLFRRDYGHPGLGEDFGNAVLVAPDDSIYIAGASVLEHSRLWLARVTP